MLDDTGHITRRFPSAWIHILSSDPIINTIILFCDFEWNPTPLLTKQVPKVELLRSYEKEINRLKGEIAALQEELNLKSTNRVAYFQKYLGPEIAELKKVMGRGGEEQQQMMGEGVYEQRPV